MKRKKETERLRFIKKYKRISKEISHKTKQKARIIEDPKLDRKIKAANKNIEKMKKEMKKVVVGQDKVTHDILVCLLCNGSVLIEGVPGIAKTLIVNALATSTGCKFNRIQFTADLLPSDITGFEAYSREKGFFIVKGPIFANFVLADEINRAPPKVQSALIEVMQERQVTIGKKTFLMQEPFIIFATENPIESKGVYQLPEAQIDRFFFKTLIEYPSFEEEKLIMEKNITIKKFSEYNLKKVVNPEDIIKMQKLVKEIFVKPKIKEYIARIVDYTRYPKKNKLKFAKYISFGASPRASINLYLAAKANALLSNRSFVIPQDVKDAAFNVLRHRILLNYEGLINNIKPETIISEILSKVEVP